MNHALIHGDCRDVLRSLPEKSVQCCVTSPPYWGLRSYEGVAPSVWGDGDPLCDQPSRGDHRWREDGSCDRLWCGAWRGHLGLEPTPEMFTDHIVEVFHEVWRVLRDDGTLWLNLGDSYNSVAGNYRGITQGIKGEAGSTLAGGMKRLANKAYRYDERRTSIPGLKPKDLIGIPWRVAFALQADGWYLRSAIVWAKGRDGELQQIGPGSPMPESGSDRPVKSYELVFLMTKKPRCYYDDLAVRVDWPGGSHRLRDVWFINKQGFKGAHFATFPEKLVATCLKAGTSSKGCCPECGTPWRRMVEKDRQPTRPARDNKQDATGMANRDPTRHVTEVKTVGWQPGCDCEGDGVGTVQDNRHMPIPCTVLDPFIGSGTTGVVAIQLGLHVYGIDASAKYLDMARRRIENPNPAPTPADAPGQELLF